MHVQQSNSHADCVQLTTLTTVSIKRFAYQFAKVKNLDCRPRPEKIAFAQSKSDRLGTERSICSVAVIDAHLPPAPQAAQHNSMFRFSKKWNFLPKF